MAFSTPVILAIPSCHVRGPGWDLVSITHEPAGPRLSPTERSTIRRGKDRAVTDPAALRAVLDAGLICHVALTIDGAPRVVPTGYGHDGDTIYIHGSSAAASLRHGRGAPVCVAVTLLDGVVYARSSFHCSVNYRSAVIHGQARVIDEPVAKLRALRTITEHLAPGTWDHARSPSRKELAQTTVLAVDLAEASVKVRSGGPGDEPDDVIANRAWAGVLPLRQHWDTPEPAADLPPDFAIPDHVRDRRGG